MNNPDNVFQTISIWVKDNATIEFRGNGCICVQDYETGNDIDIRINREQMKAISLFLRKSSNGDTSGIGVESGES